MTHPWFEGVTTPRILAHRGLVTADDAAHAVAENSFAAVAAAHAAGCDYIESDCHLTADGVVVLFHDSDLPRVTGDPRPVSAVSAAELDALMAGHGGLITLAQALDAFPAVRFNLDVKAPAAATPVGTLVAPHGDRVLITSFSDDRRLEALAAASRAGPGIRPATWAGTATITRLLTALGARSERLVSRALAGIEAVQVPERHRRIRIVTPRLIAAAHRHDVEVHVWTINDPAEMRRLIDMGVDGIVTDRADLALETLRA